MATDLVSIASPDVVSISITDKRKFDQIPLIDTVINDIDHGNVHTKTLHNNRVCVVFQHWEAHAC